MNLCLLFSSCDSLDEECDGCVTGSPDCSICSFEDTISGQCGAACGEGWSMFGDNCYKLLDNSGEQYFDISVCTEECQLAGGNLTSIHSAEENSFVASLLRKSKSGFGEQVTWNGNYQK